MGELLKSTKKSLNLNFAISLDVEREIEYGLRLETFLSGRSIFVD